MRVENLIALGLGALGRGARSNALGLWVERERGVGRYHLWRPEQCLAERPDWVALTLSEAASTVAFVARRCTDGPEGWARRVGRLLAEQAPEMADLLALAVGAAQERAAATE